MRSKNCFKNDARTPQAEAAKSEKAFLCTLCFTFTLKKDNERVQQEKRNDAIYQKVTVILGHLFHLCSHSVAQCRASKYECMLKISRKIRTVRLKSFYMVLIKEKVYLMSMRNLFIQIKNAQLAWL